MSIRIACIATLLLTQSLWAANPMELSVRWGELEPTVAGKHVGMVLPNGAHIEGRALVVQPEALIIKITKTSDRKVQPKGEASVPRSAVSVLQVMNYSVRWRIIGTILGPALAAVVGTMAFFRVAGDWDELPKYIGFCSAGMFGSGVGGYYLGKRADRHVTTIRIVQ